MKDQTPPPYVVRPLDPSTWPAFARLVEANGGVWGGCWCMGFHVKPGQSRTPAQNRVEKEQRVHGGRTHATLVFDGELRLGWCQFGSPEEELPEVNGFARPRPIAPQRWVVTKIVVAGEGQASRVTPMQRSP